MARYAIGDLQGCYQEYQALLSKIGFNAGVDTVWLVGDLVNRGPQSLKCLRHAYRHESSVQAVLGNHDLHLLAIAYGFGKHKKNDTLLEILNAPDKTLLLDWLRHRPLLDETEQHIMVHAGIWPQWTLNHARERAAEVAHTLRHQPHEFFREMYGNHPDWDDPKAHPIERQRFAVNSFTRMRAISQDGHMDFHFKSTLAEMPSHLRAWFQLPRQIQAPTIVFGHWSALGLHHESNICALDTGALWGGSLTALNLDTGEIFQVASSRPKRF